MKETTKDNPQNRINILLIFEKLINKINRNLNSDPVNEANINTQYGTTQVLHSNLYFAIPNNESTSDSSITPQGTLKMLKNQLQRKLLT